MQRVLVVDDEQLVADTLTLVFGKSGFDAQAAYSANHGLERAREIGVTARTDDFDLPSLLR